MADIDLSNICKSYGGEDVAAGIDLHIPNGSFTVVVGPSGCGKSTLLRLLAGLDAIDEGAISIGGVDVSRLPPAQRGLAMVFQSYALYPHMTVRENISFGLRLARMAKAAIAERVATAAEMLQLTDLLDRKPGELSGGQRQRVAIGRAIVREPDAFLFDEPLSNLDASLRSQMRIELKELHGRLGATMVYVTHDQVEAMTMADQIVILNKGRVEQVGRPLEVYDHPATLFVAGFIGSPPMNIVDGAFAERYGAHAVGFRPENVLIADDASIGNARVRLVEHLGNDTIVYAHHEQAGLMTIRLPGQHDFAVAETIPLALKPGALHSFDSRGRRVTDAQDTPE